VILVSERIATYFTACFHSIFHGSVAVDVVWRKRDVRVANPMTHDSKTKMHGRDAGVSAGLSFVTKAGSIIIQNLTMAKLYALSL
jgi:hypothetical protein